MADSLEVFQKIFGDIQIHSEAREVVSPFSVSVGRAPERIEMELFDIECSSDLEMKFINVITDSVWQRKKKIVPVFGSDNN
jgi:hypothetical protein